MRRRSSRTTGRIYSRRHHHKDKEDGMKIDFNDVRKVYVELPAEDETPLYVGLLMTSTNGTCDAAQNRNVAYTRFMQSIGFRQGASCACAFWHPKK